MLVYAEAPASARAALTEALALFASGADKRNEARVLNYLGAVEFVAARRPRLSAGVSRRSRSRARRRSRGTRAFVLSTSPKVSATPATYERAAELYTRAIEIAATRTGQRGVRFTASATSHWTADDLPAADRYYREALELGIDRRRPASAGVLSCWSCVYRRAQEGRDAQPAACGHSPSGSSTTSASACSRPSASVTSGSWSRRSRTATSTRRASRTRQAVTPTPRPKSSSAA